MYLLSEVRPTGMVGEGRDRERECVCVCVGRGGAPVVFEHAKVGAVLCLAVAVGVGRAGEFGATVGGGGGQKRCLEMLTVGGVAVGRSVGHSRLLESHGQIKGICALADELRLAARTAAVVCAAAGAGARVWHGRRRL